MTFCRHPFPTRRSCDLYHVSVSTSLDSIVFDPSGLSTETGTIRVSRGALSDSVAVTGFGSVIRRSEERRVGKECSGGRPPEHGKKKRQHGEEGGSGCGG